MSEGSQEGVYAPPYVDPSEHTINIGGTDYHSDISETDKVSTYTGLDDYDTLFAARHGRGDTPWTPTNLTLSTRRLTASPGPSRKLCLSMFRTPLNRNLGKYQLPHIWDHLLQASPMFQCKPTQQPTSTTNTYPPTGTTPLSFLHPPTIQLGGEHTFS